MLKATPRLFSASQDLVQHHIKYLKLIISKRELIHLKTYQIIKELRKLQSVHQLVSKPRNSHILGII